MKTVVIYDQLDASLSFFVYEGDLTHLDGAYINDSSTPNEKARELSDLLYEEGGERRIPLLEKFPVDEVRAGAPVIVVGFLP